MWRWILSLPIIFMLLLVFVLVQARQQPVRSNVILFASDRQGQAELYSVNIDGTDLRRITYNNYEEFAVSLSPDGRWVAYSAADNPDAAVNIFMVRLNGTGNHTLLRREGNSNSPTWSPDSEWIAFVNYRNIFIIRPDGTHLQNVSNVVNGIAHSPQWSRDGQWLYFFQAVEYGSVYDLMRLNLETAEITQIASGVGGDSRLWWSTDKQRLYYFSAPADRRLHSIRPGESENHIVLQEPILNMVACPDRTCILLELSGMTVKFNLQDESIQQTHDPFLLEMPQGRLSPDRRTFIYTKQISSQQTDIFIRSLEDGNTVNLTHHPANDFSAWWVPPVDLDWHPSWLISGVFLTLIVNIGLWIMI